MPDKLKITPHEPGQPLVGAEESFEDAKLLLRLLQEKRMGKLKIAPHEPEQPLVGLKETLEDAVALQRLLDEKRERVRKAKQKLRLDEIVPQKWQ